MLLAGLLALLLSGCADTQQQPDAPAPNGKTMLISFESLQRPSSPNTWLIGPAAAPASLQVDSHAPEFGIPAAQLVDAWTQIVKRQPRTRIVAVSDDGLQVEAEQRSALFRFVDKISFRAVALDGDRSTFYAYSRSQVGYWDLGVNRKRLERWVAELR